MAKNFKKTKNSTKLDVELKTVPKRQEYNYHADELHFSFCNYEVKLYEDEDGEAVEFEHFVQPVPQQRRYPKVCGIFDPRLVDNLRTMNVSYMRPSQIVTMMATSFAQPMRDGKTIPGYTDLVCISSTGSGKTIAYLVAAIQKCIEVIKTLPVCKKRTPTVLIFAHSNPLVIEIFQTALKLTDGTNVKVELIAGSTKFIRNTFFDIGICTMGRFQNHLYDSNHVQIYTRNLKLLVVDEADEMAKTDEFQEIYTTLANTAEFSTLLYSATHSSACFPIVNQENVYEFAGGPVNQVASSVKTVFWEVHSLSSSRITGAVNRKVKVGAYKPNEIRHPFDTLFLFLQEKLFDVSDNSKKVIVFVKRCTVADYTAQRLCFYGIPAVSIHGKHDIEIREKFLQEFDDGKCRVLIATNLYTRGVDVNVEYVVNYDLPVDYHQWIHRCGRTGRNGKRGVAITFVDMNNMEDYPLNVLQKIAFDVKTEIPPFLKAFVENAKQQKAKMEQGFFTMAQEYGM